MESKAHWITLRRNDEYDDLSIYTVSRTVLI